MFQSLNLFKAINCPFYSQSTNTLNCDRPHCQFKHPVLHSLSSTTQVAAVVAPSTSTAKNEEKISNSTENNCSNQLEKLPLMLENISNALQTVQQMISSNDSLAKLVSASSSNTTAVQINSTLANLNSVIKSVSASSSPSSSSAIQTSKNVSSTNNLKRHQSTPDYNPTPINELKKIKQEKLLSDNHEQDQEEKDEFTKIKRRRKLSESSELSEKVTKPKEVNTNTKKNKNEPVITNKTITSPTTPKCDLVSFSKLSLSQQVLKRYEMMNKAPPTAAAVNEAKQKKLNTISQTGAAAASTKAANVPHLIMDTNSNATLKIPLPMRVRYLQLIFDNGKASFTTIEKACEKAAEQEKSIYDRAKNKTIYTNLAANLIKSLRTQQQQTQSSTSSTKSVTTSGTMSLNNTQNQLKLNSSMQIKTTCYSHEAMLSGPKASKISYSINRVKQVEIKDLNPIQLYKMFYEYVLNEKQLEENSFPKWMQISSTKESERYAFIPNFSKQNKSKSSSFLNKSEDQLVGKSKNNGECNNKADDILEIQKVGMLTKQCKRCNKNFCLKDLQYLSTNSECVYHWGKLRNTRVNKAIEQKYSCCNGDVNSGGCETGKHVHDGEYDGYGKGNFLTGYVETGEASSPNDLLNKNSSVNIFAIDCEMCYTTKGLELTRVSVVDLNQKEIYESLVKPDAQIIDYNTRWSGLTEKSLKNCNKKLKQVQNDLLRIFNKDTILVGHSLESDFKALKLIHKTVVDTSCVFPHKMGPPYKRALRNLMSEHLQIIIQEDVEGHDSKEDANSCIQLMMWKISEDLKNSKKLSSLIKETTSMSVQNDSSFSSTKTSMSVSIGKQNQTKSNISIKSSNQINNQNKLIQSPNSKLTQSKIVTK